MSIKTENENGEEIEAFTADEVAAQVAAARQESLSELSKAKEDAEKYKRVATEQTTNFKKLNELSAEETAALSSEKIEAMKRSEAAEARVKELEDKFNEDTQNRIKSTTEAELARYHGNDPKLKAALEENFKLINLEGNDLETIQKRAKLAADMEAGKTGRPNPLRASWNGSAAPMPKDKNEKEAFMESEKAKEAMRRMGDKV